MSSPLKSLPDFMYQQFNQGNFNALPEFKNRANGTAANATSGNTTAMRSDEVVNIPPMTSPVTGAYCTRCVVIGQNANLEVRIGAEFILGTLTVSGNSSSGLTSMPSRKINKGSSVQTAAYDPYLYVDTSLTAVTPVVTIGYTNQAGTTGRTATLTLPSNALKSSAFRIAPHLQGNDTGIRAVTSISISTGSAGVLKVAGLLPIASMPVATGGFANTFGSPQGKGSEVYAVEGGDVIACYRLGSLVPDRVLTQLVFSPETP